MPMAPMGGLVVFFDFDGTIAETEPLILGATNLMLKEEDGINFQWSPEVYRGLLRVGNTEARLQHYFNKHSCWPAGMSTSSVEEQAAYAKKLKEKKDVYFDQLMDQAQQQFQCRPGILRLMEETILELEGTCVIVSNTNTDLVLKQFNRLIENAPNHHYLLDSVRVVGGDLSPTGRRKPSPDLYLYASELVGCDPRDVIVVEDSSEGLTAALGAGHSDIIITKNYYTKECDFTGATLVLDEIPDDFSLAQYIDNWRAGFDVQVLS